MVPIRLQFFKDIANQLEGYLETFQTKKPMVPFLTDALQSIVMSLMKIFINLEVLDAANCSENELVKLDVFNLGNQIPSDIIRLPTATKTLLKSTVIDVNKKHQFKKECVAMLVAIVQKLQERIPLKHLIGCGSCLDPYQMACNKEECSLGFSGIVYKLYKNRWITSNDADLAKKEFDNFLESVKHEYKDDFLMYDV